MKRLEIAKRVLFWTGVILLPGGVTLLVVNPKVREFVSKQVAKIKKSGGERHV